VLGGAWPGEYDHERWMRQQVREQERKQRADMAAAKAGDRERKQEQDAAGKAEAERLTRDVGTRSRG
jgi:restriction system protein